VSCDLCGAEAVGELDYEDGEILVGCADCLLEIVSDPAKPVDRIQEYGRQDVE